MYEKFTDRARKVFALANQEAQRFNHEYIGTEHILLGLVKEGSGIGANVLKNLGVSLATARMAIEKLSPSGPEMVTMGKLPQTARAKRTSEYAVEESTKLGHNYVGTEHLLLALLRVDDGTAAKALVALGLKLEDVRKEVLEILGAGGEEQADGAEDGVLLTPIEPASEEVVGEFLVCSVVGDEKGDLVVVAKGTRGTVVFMVIDGAKDPRLFPLGAPGAHHLVITLKKK